MLTVVIPTLDEAATLPALLGDLAGLATEHELVVVDGGSTDDTPRVAAALGARVVATRAGRGEQLATGAAAARGDLLCFLHADARLPPAAVRALDDVATRRPSGAFAFRLAIASPRLALRLVAWGANLRARWLALPYGDQGLVVSRADYDAAGGYPAWPLMEDVALVRALARTTPVRLLPATIVVSPRRWARDGVLRRTLANWWLLARFLAGASPHHLARRYRPAGS